MNCQQTGVTSFHVTTINGSISDVKMNLEKVEGLCFPLLFPHGEGGYTNGIKVCLSPAEYSITRMLMPEKIRGKCMTALSEDLKLQIIDGRNGKSFASDEDVCQVELHGMSINIRQHLRVNQFMMMERLAQYWLLDLYSQICDQRLITITQMRDQIMMGQPRKRWQRCSDCVEDALEEEEWRNAR